MSTIVAVHGNSRQHRGVDNRAINFFAGILLFASLCYSLGDIEVQTVLSKRLYQLQDTVVVALKVSIPSEYHLYGNPLGPGIGKPLQISVDSTEAVEWSLITKQPSRKFTPPIGDWVWAYEDEALFFIKGTIKSLEHSSIRGVITIDGLICNTACVPVVKSAPFIINVGTAQPGVAHFFGNDDLLKKYQSYHDTMSISSVVVTAPASFNGLSLSGLGSIATGNEQIVDSDVQWDYKPIEKKIEFNLFLALLFGFIAGIILNAMPCVLPVIGIKILSFSHSSGGSRKEALLRSVMFSLGILAVFMVLASLAAFAKFSWGEQFQNPRVLVGIVALIVIFALGMFDVFIISVPGSLGNMEHKSGKGLWGDFFRGMFATVLATPCSGPLLGATLAWTLTQQPAVVFTVFASIGIGMAAPYVLFSASRRLSKLIPKPGIWMNDFKYLMGFILLGMAVYLMIGLPKDMLISTIGFCLVLSFTVWGYARYAPWGSSLLRKIITVSVMLLIASGGGYFNFVTLYSLIAEDVAGKVGDESAHWIDFSPSVLKAAHASGTNIMVDFTANWCMNCQYNKVTVLHTKKIMDLVEKKRVITMKADLTRPNPQVDSLLTHLGSRSVPFLAIFPGDNPFEPIVMRDLFNKNALATVLSKLQ